MDVDEIKAIVSEGEFFKINAIYYPEIFSIVFFGLLLKRETLKKVPSEMTCPSAYLLKH